MTATNHRDRLIEAFKDHQQAKADNPICPTCNGTMFATNNPPSICRDCNGKGYLNQKTPR